MTCQLAEPHGCWACSAQDKPVGPVLDCGRPAVPPPLLVHTRSNAEVEEQIAALRNQLLRAEQDRQLLQQQLAETHVQRKCDQKKADKVHGLPCAQGCVDPREARSSHDGRAP